MVNISIDKDVYEFIQNNAIIFVDKTPNDTLRRLFRLQGKNSTKTIPYSTLRRKAPWTDLLKLKAVRQLTDPYGKTKKAVHSILWKSRNH